MLTSRTLVNSCRRHGSGCRAILSFAWRWLCAAPRRDGHRHSAGGPSITVRGAWRLCAQRDWLGLRLDRCRRHAALDSIGGLVTGFRAGMAVPDWPNTYGSNMFLYPLAKMTGGVFLRACPSPAGLAGRVHGVDAGDPAVRSIAARIGAMILIWIVGFCVLLQGVMGGLRVTDNSPHLAVVHGFFAHVILAGMIGVAVLLAAERTTLHNSQTASTNAVRYRTKPTSSCRRSWCWPFSVQTLLGTLVRQMDMGLLIHLSVAMLVAMLAIVVGVRLWGLYPHIRRFCPRRRGLDRAWSSCNYPAGRDLAGLPHAAGGGVAFSRAVAGAGQCLAARGRMRS